MTLPALLSLRLTLTPLFHDSILFPFTILIQITRKGHQMDPTYQHYCVWWYHGSWHHHGTAALVSDSLLLSTAQSKMSISFLFTGGRKADPIVQLKFLPISSLKQGNLPQIVRCDMPTWGSFYVVIHSYFQLHKKNLLHLSLIVNLILSPKDCI